MTRLPRLLAGAGAVALIGALVAGGLVHAQRPPEHPHAPVATGTTAAGGAGPGPRRVSEDELHRHGGVPRGWKFSVPPGDAARGRELFRELECYKCHEIQTEKFPEPSDG